MIQFGVLDDKRAAEAAMPHTQRWTARTLYEQLVETADRFPDRPAISFQLKSDPGDKSVTLTWRQLRAEVTRTANLLYGLGVGPDRRGRLHPAERARSPDHAARRRHGGHRQPDQPAARPRDHRRHPARDRRQGGRHPRAVPQDRPRPAGRQGRRPRARCRDGAAGRSLPLSRAARLLDRPLHPPETEAEPQGEGARFRQGGACPPRRRARFRRDRRRPLLRLFPHRRHHGHAESGPAPRRRHALQRLARLLDAVHRRRRADVPACRCSTCSRPIRSSCPA